MQQDLTELENRLWAAADDLRANSGLKASEYGTPVLGLIFPRPHRHDRRCRCVSGRRGPLVIAREGSDER
ncbi:MAG: hypothetical protein H0V57_06835 [Thermoleophilaceae bacterium]|nr:hypothetical protein [Thermoleophilaceae bacterium]